MGRTHDIDLLLTLLDDLYEPSFPIWKIVKPTPPTTSPVFGNAIGAPKIEVDDLDLADLLAHLGPAHATIRACLRDAHGHHLQATNEGAPNEMVSPNAP